MSMMIHGLSFDWIQFPDLGGLGQRETYRTHGRFDRFNCVDNRLGVYFFIHESQHVHYVGMSGEVPDHQYQTGNFMKYRISQHFQPEDLGGNFRDYWYKENGYEKNDENFWHRFGPYIENLQLITLSTDGTNPNTINPEILREIERVFICEFRPTYNRTIPNCDDPFVLTPDERNGLTTCGVCLRLHR